MDPEMKKKIDETLAQVKEPQSEEPIVNLGLLEKVTYSEKEKTMPSVLRNKWSCKGRHSTQGSRGIREGLP